MSRLCCRTLQSLGLALGISLLCLSVVVLVRG
jgi:hypothetical protein